MNTRIAPAILSVAFCCGVVSAATAPSWDFTTGLAGWRDEGLSAPQTDGQGTLWPGSEAGISLRSPDLRLPTQAFQIIEMALSITGRGPLRLLWQGENQAGTPTGWQGSLPVQAPADSRMHEVRLLPLWQNLRAITGLRLVAPGGTQVRLRSIRVTSSDTRSSAQTEWRFDNARDAGAWLPLLGAATLRPQAEGLQVRLVDPEVMLASPPLQAPTYQFEWLSLELSTPAPATARLQWATTAQRGLHGPEVALRPGRHTYNVHCADERSWSGQLAGLGLTLGRGTSPRPTAAGTEVTLHSLRLSNAPQGPADLRTRYAGPVEARLVPNRATRLVWVLQNDGGEEARNIAVTAEGDAAVSIPPGMSVIKRLPHGMPQPMTWVLKASGPGVVRLRAEYEGRALVEEVRVAPVEAETGRGVGEADGDPASEPVIRRGQPPVRPGTDPSVLAHYHAPPLMAWGPAVLDRMLFRRPWLGDYDVTPEVVDWQVKWALEHGLAGFITDVAKGQAGVLDAFLGSRLARQAKLCLNWVEPTPTAEAARELLDELAPIMALPNVVRLADKPVLIVGGSLQRQGGAWGLSDLQGVAEERQVALVAALPLAMATPELLQKAGYAAAVDLHTEAQVPAGEPVLQAWENATQRKVPHIMSLQPAWQGDLTPGRLQTLLRVALLRAQRPDSHALPVIIAGDWNGEQSIEPRGPEGARWLEAVASALEVPSATAGRMISGPSFDRDYPMPPCAWEFDTREGWTSAMGMSVMTISDGQLTGRTDSNQPALFGGETLLDTRAFQTVVIGLAVSSGTQGRLYWRTSLRKFTVEHSLPFDIIADGAPHEYRLPVGEAPGWTGYLEGLRLDPTDVAGAAVSLDYVRIMP